MIESGEKDERERVRSSSMTKAMIVIEVASS